MYAGAFLLWKREGNDDIINSALDVEGKNAHRELEKRTEEASEPENV